MEVEKGLTNFSFVCSHFPSSSFPHSVRDVQGIIITIKIENVNNPKLFGNTKKSSECEKIFA
jgi:hypothetical protein